MILGGRGGLVGRVAATGQEKRKNEGEREERGKSARVQECGLVSPSLCLWAAYGHRPCSSAEHSADSGDTTAEHTVHYSTVQYSSVQLRISP